VTPYAALPAAASVAGSTPLVLAQSNQKDPGGQQDDFGKSSPVGLLLLIVFFVAVVFLVRSMTKHLKRVPASFDPPADPPPADKSDQPSA
jgi:hypothetical protein